MEYTVHQLAQLAGVSTRTLRWYDRIGLLRPTRVGANGYRFYGGPEVDRLQQILFYRALGVSLERIGRILDDPSFDRLTALYGHLTALQAEQARIGGLIETVQQTIAMQERKTMMSDEEKFAAFKRETLKENQARYGAEAREKYGDQAVEKADERIMGLSREDYAQWKKLEDEIRAALEDAVASGDAPEGEKGRMAAQLHKRWLSYSLEYTPELQRCLAQMYPMDPRFTDYYDRTVPGCAAFLRDAVLHWIR